MKKKAKKQVKPLGFIKVSRKFFKDENTDNLVAFIVNDSKTKGIAVGDYLVIETGVQTQENDRVCVKKGKEYVCGIRKTVLKEVSVVKNGLEVGTDIVIYPLSENSKMKPFKVKEAQIFGRIAKFFKGYQSEEQEL